jgi:hypothetical protein
MTIDINGDAVRVLDDFLYYASTYPRQLADAMWWCEDTFADCARCLKEAYDEALSAEHRR